MMNKLTAAKSGFEPVALLTYMGVEQFVGVGVTPDGTPAFYRLDATAASVTPLNFEPNPASDPDERFWEVDLAIHHGMDKYRHHIRVEFQPEHEGTDQAFMAYFGNYEIDFYDSREKALLRARDDAYAYVPESGLIETLRIFEKLGERFEIAGDATTSNHYLALVSQYGADMVRKPDPVAAKAEIIRQFGEKAVELGVPSERQNEAGANMFASMVRVSVKHAAERDRDLRRCGAPAPKRGEPGDDLVKWLDGMPEALRGQIITNNVRPYVPLYEPMPLDAEEVRDVKKAVLGTLDGDKVRAFDDFNDFFNWVQVTYAYDARDGDFDSNMTDPALLKAVYADLGKDEQELEAAQAVAHPFAVLRIDSVDTAAFADIGFSVEAARIIREVREAIKEGLPQDLVELRDTNGNVVGAFSMEAEEPLSAGVASGVVISIDSSLFAEGPRHLRVIEALENASKGVLSHGDSVLSADFRVLTEIGTAVGRAVVMQSPEVTAKPLVEGPELSL